MSDNDYVSMRLDESQSMSGGGMKWQDVAALIAWSIVLICLVYVVAEHPYLVDWFFNSND